MRETSEWHDYARVALGVIRLFYGGVALVTPQLLATRIGIDPDTTPGGLYVFRMFGIRTVLIGADLLFTDGARRTEAVSRAPVIHATDTLAAFIAALSGKLPGSSGLLITVVSAINTVLALYAKQGLSSTD